MEPVRTVWRPVLVHACADPYVPGPPYCTYGLRVPASWVACVPEAQGSCCATVCTPYAYQPPACRTYRVPCGAPQVHANGWADAAADGAFTRMHGALMLAVDGLAALALLLLAGVMCGGRDLVV